MRQRDRRDLVSGALFVVAIFAGLLLNALIAAA